MSLRCPFCHKELIMNSQENECYCPEHRILYNFSNRTAVPAENAPEYVKDSYKLLEEISQNKWFVTYGPNVLFNKEFRYDQVIKLRQLYDAQMLRMPLCTDLLYSVGNSAAFLTKDLLAFSVMQNDAGNIINVDIHINDVGVALITHVLVELKYEKLTPVQDKALLALIAPTFSQTANALLNTTVESYKALYTDQVLWCATVGGKFNLVTGAFTSTNIIEQLVNTMSDGMAFCSVKHWERCHKREHKIYDDAIPGVSADLLNTAVQLSRTPELRECPDSNYMFWTHSSFLETAAPFNCINKQELNNVIHCGETLNKLWDAFGTHIFRVDTDEHRFSSEEYMEYCVKKVKAVQGFYDYLFC